VSQRAADAPGVGRPTSVSGSRGRSALAELPSRAGCLSAPGFVRVAWDPGFGCCSAERIARLRAAACCRSSMWALASARARSGCSIWASLPLRRRFTPPTRSPRIVRSWVAGWCVSVPSSQLEFVCRRFWLRLVENLADEFRVSVVSQWLW